MELQTKITKILVFIFVHVFAFTKDLYIFIWFQIILKCSFISIWRISFNISCRTNLMVMNSLSFFFFFFLIWECLNFSAFFFFIICMACSILVPQPGIKPIPPAVETWSLNHWTAREIPCLLFRRRVLLGMNALLAC